MSNTREVIERAIKIIDKCQDSRCAKSYVAIPVRDALQALLDSGDSFGKDNGWDGYVYDKGAEQMRERCSSREVAIDIACEAHRIYGQRDARDTDGYDGALAEFIEYKISNLPLRGKK